MDEKIFKAYDIRGLYPEELDEDTAYRIGMAFVTFLRCKEVVVGQDMRSSSPGLFKSLAKGIADQGAEVIDIGYCSTPYFYFGTAEHPAGIMVTASHNPAKYNGFKMCRQGTIPIGGDSGMDDIKRLSLEKGFPVHGAGDNGIEKGSIRKKDLDEEFIRHNLKFLDSSVKDRKLKVVIDAGNGMAGYTYPKVFDRLENIELVPLYFDVDMTFPNHEANPIKPENVEDLQKKVVEEKADFGVAVDGDCDRCFFVDEEGSTVSADLMTALLAKVILKKNPGATILYDLRSSWVTKEVIEENGGNPEVCRVGHAFIKKQMREQDALFAGELSGHLYYKESYYSESSLISTILVINLLRQEDEKLSGLVNPLKKYFPSGEINSKVDDKQAKMDELEERFKDKARSVSHLDGIKLEFDDWWFNVRPSNTEPLLRLNLEAKTEDKMEEMRDMILSIIRED